MAKHKVIAVDQTIVWTTVPKEFIDAFNYTTTFAQAAARVSNRDPTSRAYFDTLKLEYQRVGWNVLQAEKVGYQVGHEGSIVPAQVISRILAPYLTGKQRRQMSALLDAMRTDNRIHDFCSFFWSKSHVGTNPPKQTMSFGPLVVELGQPVFNCIYYAFDYQADSWRSMFVSHRSSSANLQFYRIKMMLNMPLYNRYKSILIGRLEEKIKEHVEQTELDL
ncbi:hypothetical protein WME97_45565 [Sorangium sp. So ce367]|uniref:hypothetical protein n=1 Tax=Sorangium sp. So ce367 TaxID=3133305 RepID=UPI003F62A597